MKKIVIITLALFVQQALFAQKPTTNTPPPPADKDFVALPDDAAKALAKGKKKKEKVFTVVEQMPQYPGGEEALRKYLSKNIQYPELARDAGTTGTVYITFVIDKKGKVKNVILLRGLSGTGAKACNDEALRVVNSMPRWVAGKQKGKAVAVQYNLPIKFSLR